MVGALPQSLPRLRFNKEGNLLAVTTVDSGLKVLANAEGLKYLRTIEARSYEASKAPMETKVLFSLWFYFLSLLLTNFHWLVFIDVRNLISLISMD